MTLQEWSISLTVIFFIASAITVLVFIVLYQAMAQWEKTQLGRHIMAFASSTFLVLLQGIVGFANPGYYGQLVLRPLAYFLFLVVWVWRVVIFLQEQAQVREEIARSSGEEQ